MKYIDKSKNEDAAKRVLDELLSDNWIDDKFTNVDYDELKKNKYKNRFISLLIDEQQNLCCYCMKQLDLIATTLEHIIPHNINHQEFAKYLTNIILARNVIHKDSFVRTTKQIPPEFYPHDISYHNLIASCDSNANCNHYRKNKFISCFFYDTDIQTKVEYDDEGIAYSEEYYDDLATTGISTSNELKMYRKIWKAISMEKEDINDLSNDDIEMVVLKLHGDAKFLKILNNFYGSPSKKDELMKFKWFFYYYKSLL